MICFVGRLSQALSSSKFFWHCFGCNACLVESPVNKILQGASNHFVGCLNTGHATVLNCDSLLLPFLALKSNMSFFIYSLTILLFLPVTLIVIRSASFF